MSTGVSRSTHRSSNDTSMVAFTQSAGEREPKASLGQGGGGHTRRDPKRSKSPDMPKRHRGDQPVPYDRRT